MQTETLSPPEALPPAERDKAAVAAVRRGDSARYRELVERHSRQVYAVAWSRLGDATLAEEAAQEAFIRGYRYLGMLGDGAKFSAWIGAIVRNAAIRLGMRQRRELDQRARWALEQPVATEAPPELDEPGRAETLRQVLAELPAAHRDCLVLFYLEGKSGTEAATALGISETAFRVRLHRARSVLRERMEEHLGESLGRLRPPATLVPSVMGVVLSSTSAKMGGAGVGATFGGVLAKVLPFKAAIMLLPVLWVLPTFGLSWLMGEAERRNFRDAQGFRVRLHRRTYWRLMWIMPAAMLSTMILVHAFHAVIGYQTLYLALAFYSAISAVITARQFTINRNRFQVGMFVNCVLVSLGMFIVGMGWIPVSWGSLVIVLPMGLMLFVMDERPVRMDYNLFLRASQGMLPDLGAEPPGGTPTMLPQREGPLGFARFLGERWLTINFQWTDSGLKLRLPGVIQVNWMRDMYNLGWSRCSWILLCWDHTVQVHLGSRDEQALGKLSERALSMPAKLEQPVALAVRQAWREYAAGQDASAERTLGQVPLADVFLHPVSRTGVTRMRKVLIGAACLTAFVLIGYAHWLKHADSKPAKLPARASAVRQP